MPSRFIGRVTELAVLGSRLSAIATNGEARAVAIRGRRQVGKSRLVQEFCDRADVPYMYYAATKGQSSVEAIGEFLAELRESTLPRDRDLVPAEPVGGWREAFRALAAVLPDRPSIVVLDEVPWLAEQDEVFDGALQTAWDRLLSRRPVLLLLLGSDLHMMERITAYDRPFFGRADSLLLGPLNPAEVRKALDLGATNSIDAHLLTGGLPGILRTWPDSVPPREFMERQCADPASPLFGVPEIALLAEFPAPDTARRVIEAIGGDRRTHANIAATAGSRAGAIPSGTLSPILHRLTEDKHVLAVEEPLSTKHGRPALYRIADSNMSFYLRIGRHVQEYVRRGNQTRALDLFSRRWISWRGMAVGPIVRDALRLAADRESWPWPDATAVGGWWNRAFQPEVDLVGADRAPLASRLYYAGSVKWLKREFDGGDLAALQRGVVAVPGFELGTTGLIAVSRAGVSDTVSSQVALCWGAEEVVAAFAV